MTPIILVACAVVAAATWAGVAIRTRRRAACEVTSSPEQTETKGLAWVVGAFLICPCHLPLTLGLVATLLAGTAAGTALGEHPFIAGTVLTVAWGAATWHGLRLLRLSGAAQPTSIKER
jgi:hypothetical protein